MLAGKNAPGDAIAETGEFSQLQPKDEFLQTVVEKLRGFVQKQYALEDFTVRSDQSFSALGIDSFSLLEIVVFVEREFGLVLPLASLTPANLTSISSFACCVADFKTEYERTRA